MKPSSLLSFPPGTVAAAVIFLWIACAGSGCGPKNTPGVVSAEFLDDKYADGVPQAGERVRITLTGDLPTDFDPSGVRVFSGPPDRELQVQAVRVESLPDVLDLEFLSSERDLKFNGNGDTTSPTALKVDLGQGGTGGQWVDLQPRRGFPVLLRAVWVDRPVEGSPGGNLVVDEGDWISLVFDSGIRIRGDPPTRTNVEVPRDLILSQPGDRLDDREVPSRLVQVEGGDPREVRVILGSRPRLTVAGRHSGIALNGTPVQPMTTIIDRRGWPGAISRSPVDIEFEDKYFFFESRTELFPAPGHRTYHTVTDIPGGPAVIVGGRTPPPAGKTLAQVLLYDPHAPEPFRVVEDLPQALYLHTATLFPGDDGHRGTNDDFVVIAGGTDGERPLDSIYILRPDPTSPTQFSIETLPSRLKSPRIYHTATWIPPDRLLLLGGRDTRPRRGILPQAEILTFGSRAGRITLEEHREILLLPRENHTATYLGEDSAGARYVLVHGGLGRDPTVTPTDPGDPVSTDNAVVLAAPQLIRMEEQPAPGGGPPVTIELPWEYSFQMIRYGHGAVPVGFDPYSGTPVGGPREVLIAGGTLKNPYADPNLAVRRLEFPTDAGDAAQFVGKSPTYRESADALIFRFHPDNPESSTFRVVPSPSGEPRIHMALVPLEHPGVLILGGENPLQSREVYSTAEIYLPRRDRLLPLAVPLTIPRTHLRAFTTPLRAGTEVHVLGGSPPSDHPDEITDLERLLLEW